MFIPVGGGGLISGVGTYIKYLRPDVRIIGVEAEGSAGMWAALQAGKRIKLAAENLDQFADGTAVRQVGKETFRLAKQCVDEVVRVSTDEICAAIKDVFEDTRTICEPSGALSIAGCKQYSQMHPGKDPVVAIVSGANMNFDRLRHVSERTEVGEKREMLLGATIPEQQGSFRKFCRSIGKRSVTEFNYRYAPGTAAKVLVGIQTNADSVDRTKLLTSLSKNYDIVYLCCMFVIWWVDALLTWQTSDCFGLNFPSAQVHWRTSWMPSAQRLISLPSIIEIMVLPTVASSSACRYRIPNSPHFAHACGTLVIAIGKKPITTPIACSCAS